MQNLLSQILFDIQQIACAKQFRISRDMQRRVSDAGFETWWSFRLGSIAQQKQLENLKELRTQLRAL